MGVYFAAMLSGAFVVETIFAWPGVGRTVVEAVFSRDYPVVQAGVLFTSIAVRGIEPPGRSVVRTGRSEDPP